jgi:predicted dehydrogenase
MMSTIRVALVGCGGVARKYRKIYVALPGVLVDVTVDVDPKEATDAAEETNARCSSQEFESALSSTVDAVVISTPNHLHSKHATRALLAGKHVLLQKPMATCVAECDAILEAQSRSGATLGIYMNLLDHPLFHDLRRMVRQGHLGDIVLYSARLAHRGGLQWLDGKAKWRGSRDQTGGGSFIQLGVHYQHYMRWVTGMRVLGIQALSRNVACPHIEGDDLTLAQYELSGGAAFGEIQTSWCSQEEHLSLMGTKGSIHYRDNRRLEFIGDQGAFHGETIALKGDGSLEVVEECLPPEWDAAANPYNQHRRFFEAVAAGNLPDVPGEEGREDVRLVENCYRSASAGRLIR